MTRPLGPSMRFLSRTHHSRQTGPVVRALAAGGALGVVLVGASPSALAATGVAADCDALVTSEVPGDDLGTAVAAAQELDKDLRVFPRVRITVGAAADAGIDGLAEELLAACPNWQAGDGFARTDLLLVVLDAEDRVIGSYFGDDLTTDLDPLVNTAHDAMRPALSEERWGDGTALALAVYANQLQIDLDPSEPLPGWLVPAAVGGGAAVLGGGALLVSKGRKRKRRLGVKAQAAEAKTRAMSSWFDLESRWETIQAGVTVMTQAVHQDDGVAATVEQEADEAERALTEVRDELLAGPDPASVVDQAGADAAVKEWSRLEERVAAVTVEVDEVDEAVAALTTAKAEAPARVAAAEAGVGAAEAAVAEARTRTLPGSSTTYVAATAHGLVDDARRAAVGARGALEAGRFGDAVMAADTAGMRAEEAIARCGELDRLATELPAAALEAARQAREAITAAASSKNGLTTLRSKFRRTVWDDISDAPDRAHDLAEEAAELATKAAEAAHEREQDWDEATGLLARIDALLTESATLAAAPRSRDAEATAQLAEAEGAYAQVRGRVAEAESLLTASAADVSAHASAVRAAARQLAKGEELLTGKPDPLRAAAIAAEVAGIVDRASTGARGIIDAFERDRQRAEQVLGQAREELRRADRERPRSRSFNADLRRAEALLEDAEAEAAQRPGRSADQAQRALDLARRIVRDKRRSRDADRDQWRAPRRRGSSAGDILGGVIAGGMSGGFGGGIGGGTQRSNRSSGGSVLGGSPSRPAPRSSGGGGSKRSGGSFGGGGSSKF